MKNLTLLIILIFTHSLFAQNNKNNDNLSPIDEFLKQSPEFHPNKSISNEKLTSPNGFKQSSNVNLEELTEQQKNSFYLTGSDHDDKQRVNTMIEQNKNQQNFLLIAIILLVISFAIAFFMKMKSQIKNSKSESTIPTVAANLDGIKVFCYGSNLSILRLQSRIGNVNTIGQAVLCNYKLIFNKISKDKSGKASIEFTNNSQDSVWGIIVSIDEKQKKQLDRYEGLGSGYIEKKVSVKIDEVTDEVMAYIAKDDCKDNSLKPFDWYKGFIVLGAIEHNLPSGYLNQLKNIAYDTDNDFERSEENWKIIKSSLLNPYECE